MARKHLIIRVSDEERKVIGNGATKRHKTISDYLRWLALLDRDTRYRLTDDGEAALRALEETKKGEG